MQGGHLAIGSSGNELATLLAAASGVLSVSTASEWRLSGTPWTDARGIRVSLNPAFGSLSELAAETIHVAAAIKTSAYCSERTDAFEADVALQGHAGFVGCVTPGGEVTRQSREGSG